MACLGNEQRSFCRLWDYTQVLNFGLFCWLWRLLHFFQGILASTSRYNDHLLNSPIPVHLNSLIPKSLMVTLAISCLTTSNLSWFMDLTFQFPMQHCCLEHRTGLLSWVTSTTGHCFCFGSIPSFFLELLLYSYPVAYWAPTDLGSSSFSVLSFCLFILFMMFSRQEYWSGLSFPFPVDHILSELFTMTCPSWLALHGMAHSFIELDKAVVHVIRLACCLWLWFQSVCPLMPSLSQCLPCYLG